MNQRADHPQDRQRIDGTRRRLTKAGLAGPAVLGVLASRPVLADEFHMCTPSGHVSGFASANNQENCVGLGSSPAAFRAGPSTWPNGTNLGSYFINGSGGVRLFRNSPAGPLPNFADAYQVRRFSDNTTQDANVWDVLAGCNVVIDPSSPNVGNCNPNWELKAKSGYNTDITIGAEFLAALMNALKDPSYPYPARHIITSFNTVIRGGTVMVTDTAAWNAAEFVEYFRSLY